MLHQLRPRDALCTGVRFPVAAPHAVLSILRHKDISREESQDIIDSEVKTHSTDGKESRNPGINHSRVKSGCNNKKYLTKQIKTVYTVISISCEYCLIVNAHYIN